MDKELKPKAVKEEAVTPVVEDTAKHREINHLEARIKSTEAQIKENTQLLDSLKIMLSALKGS